MKVIGITGSYGKTSTKEILYTLLAEKYKTLKTEASKNSPIGIAEMILRSLRPDHEVLIVEMGAYKQGEIRTMCDMVKPEIGVITAINAQHQDLFGTIETTMKAKYELIEGLTGKKTGIFNIDNPYVFQMSKWAKRDGVHVQEFSIGKDEFAGRTKYYAYGCKVIQDGVSFTYGTGSQKKTVTVPLIGIHQVANIVAASAAAMECGMTFAQVVDAIGNIKPFDKTMKPIRGIHGSLFIDDTFNNNPDAAKAAIDYLSTKKHRKILVFQPMIELGKYTDENHKDVGAEAGKICDEIILTNDNFYMPFAEGVRSQNSHLVPRVLSPQRASDYLKKIIQPTDTILFKGKEAGLVLARLRSQIKL